MKLSCVLTKSVYVLELYLVDWICSALCSQLTSAAASSVNICLCYCSCFTLLMLQCFQIPSDEIELPIWSFSEFLLDNYVLVVDNSVQIKAAVAFQVIICIKPSDILKRVFLDSTYWTNAVSPFMVHKHSVSLSISNAFPWYTLTR